MLYFSDATSQKFGDCHVIDLRELGRAAETDTTHREWSSDAF